MNYDKEIMARMNALNNAASIVQATMEKFEEGDVDAWTDKTLEVAEKFLDWILQDMEAKKADVEQHIILYVTVSGEDIQKYEEAFKKYDFVEGRNGYWANISAERLAEMFREYKGIDKDLKFHIQLSKKVQESRR